MATEAVVRRVRDEVKRALHAAGFSEGKKLVAAVSGGPDSLAMLHVLNGLSDEMKLELHGAHLDHGLRGESSVSDARFVAETFAGLGIACSVELRDVNAYRRRRRASLEHAAREVRYAFLGEVAGAQGADAIAVAHTSDDQAETVIMHIIRGSGLTGLRGMEPLAQRTIGGVDSVILRPFLGVSGAETRAYCTAVGLQPRDDETNRSPKMRRNRLRLDLIPRLEEYNPAVRDALVRLSRSVAHDLRYLESNLDDVWGEAVQVGDGQVTIEKGVFLWLEPALQRHLLRRAAAVARGERADLEEAHVDRMIGLMEGAPGRTLDLPGGVFLTTSYDQALLTRTGQDPSPLPVLGGPYRLKVPGETQTGGWRVKATLVDPNAPQVESVHAQDSRVGAAPGPEGGTALLSRRSLQGNLVVRARRPGDRFQPLGMANAKKLQDFMVDAKIPRHWRDRIPLVVTDRGVAWVAGWRVAEWAKVIERKEWRLQLRLIRRSEAESGEPPREG